MNLSKRKRIRVIAFAVAVVAVIVFWGTVNAVNCAKLKRQLNVTRERALTELGTCLDTVCVNLDKSVYISSSPLMANISSEIWRATAAAKTNLSELTEENTEVSALYKFLSQAGEYTVALSNKLKNGEKISEKEYNNLKLLKEYGRTISEKVNYLIEENNSGGLDMESVKTTLSDNTASQNLNLSAELTDTKEVMKDYPTLICDGPFSDNIQTKESELTRNLNEVTEAQAKKKAAEFMHENEEDFFFLSTSESNMPCYIFYDIHNTVAVTKNGGIVAYFLSVDYVGESKLNEKAAIESAQKFLSLKGYRNMKKSYYATTDGVCTVNFAYCENGVTYYTDLVKVSVSLEDGSITAFDATGYLMNRKNRELPEKTKFTLASGAKKLNGDLTVLSSRKTVIPTEYETENYTFEYHCKSSDGTEVLVYIDPETGNEKELLILLYRDGGVLTK